MLVEESLQEDILVWHPEGWKSLWSTLSTEQLWAATTGCHHAGVPAPPPGQRIEVSMSCGTRRVKFHSLVPPWSTERIEGSPGLCSGKNYFNRNMTKASAKVLLHKKTVEI